MSNCKESGGANKTGKEAICMGEKTGRINDNKGH
jgi:hypothetical protein